MHIISKISSVHDGKNKRTYSIFHPLCVSSEEKCYWSHCNNLCCIWKERYKSYYIVILNDGIKNFATEISVLKLNRVLDALKRLKRTNCKQNLRKLKRRSQNRLALCSKPFPYVYIRWERFRRKTGRFCINRPNTTKIDGVTLHSLCFQNSGKKIFCTKSL